MTNRTILWLFATFVVGFGLPFAGCAGLTVVSAFALGEMSRSLAAPVVPAGSGPGVAVISVEGTILSGSAGPFAEGLAASDDIIAQIQQAKNDRDAKAIVLRVNSPGGGVVASDEIYHALQGAGKPVVVSMGELAASGGYYISMAADWIVANPNTLTGSIGVISQFANAEELLDDVGIQFITIKSGPAKDTGSPFRDMTEAERERWQALVDEVYGNFVQVVVEGRQMDEAEVREVADGSVYTGQQALELGLVDALGYEEDAIAKAAELGGITGEPRIIRYPRQQNLYDLLGASLAGRPALPTPQEVSNWIGWPTISFLYR
jgi:protease-4